MQLERVLLTANENSTSAWALVRRITGEAGLLGGATTTFDREAKRCAAKNASAPPM
jgi:hypothetical protein